MPLPQARLDRNPDRWEAEWQEHFARLEESADGTDLSLFSHPSAESIRAGMTEETHNHIALMHRITVQCQDRLRGALLVNDTAADFVQKWRSSGSAARKEHYWAAMRHIFPPDSEREHMRTGTPEISWSYLDSNDGQGYIILLRELTRKRQPNTYVYVHNTIIDGYFGLPTQWDTSIVRTTDPKLHKQLRLVLKRTYFMSIAVENIFLSFNDAPLSSVLPMKRKMTDMMGKVSLFAGVRTRDAEGLLAKPLGSPDRQCTLQGEPFKACSRCAAAGHTVRYCSRACQTADWKGGDPPHKLTCGKPPSEPKPSASLPPGTRDAWAAMLQAIEQPFEQWGFQPGPALRRTMLTLAAWPDWDYLFTVPGGKTIPVELPPEDEEAKLLIRRARSNAFLEGNIACVGCLYELLAPHARAQSAAGFSADELKAQLEREYGIDIEDARDKNRRLERYARGLCGRMEALYSLDDP